MPADLSPRHLGRRLIELALLGVPIPRVSAGEGAMA
jgi:hypothetical protein